MDAYLKAKAVWPNMTSYIIGVTLANFGRSDTGKFYLPDNYLHLNQRSY